jgi:hypothetical protein
VRCEPYFQESDIQNRVTYFERMNNIDSFVFDVPFTLDGKNQGSIEHQYIRKIVHYCKLTKDFSYRKSVSFLKKEVVSCKIN